MFLELEPPFFESTGGTSTQPPMSFSPLSRAISPINSAPFSVIENMQEVPPLEIAEEQPFIPLEYKIFSPPIDKPKQVTTPFTLTMETTVQKPSPIFIPPPREGLISVEILASQKLERGLDRVKKSLFITPSSLAIKKRTALVVQDRQTPPPDKAIPPIEVLAMAVSDNKPEGKKQNLDFQPVPLVQNPTLPLISSQSRVEAISPTTLTMKTTAKKPEPVFIPRPLDIIFVIDTSVSMLKRLSGFPERFASFLSLLSPLNWQVMITNADHGDTWFFLSNIVATKGEALQLERAGKIMQLKYLDHLIPEYNSVFLSSISLHKRGDYKKEGRDGAEDVHPCELPPHCQSYKEQPLKSLKSALIKNPDFFREEADLAVILISNSSANTKSVTPQEVIQQFEHTHGPHKRFEVYGLIIKENDQECLRENLEQQSIFPEVGVSRNIMALSDMTGGEVFSLCSPDYQELALSIAHSFASPP